MAKSMRDNVSSAYNAFMPGVRYMEGKTLHMVLILELIGSCMSVMDEVGVFTES